MQYMLKNEAGDKKKKTGKIAGMDSEFERRLTAVRLPTMDEQLPCGRRYRLFESFQCSFHEMMLGIFSKAVAQLDQRPA